MGTGIQCAHRRLQRTLGIAQFAPQLGKFSCRKPGVPLQVFKSPVSRSGGLRLEHGVGQALKLLGADPGGLGNLFQPRNLPLERTGRQGGLRRLQFPCDLVDTAGEVNSRNSIVDALGDGIALNLGQLFCCVQVSFKRGVITTDRYVNTGRFSCHASLPV